MSATSPLSDRRENAADRRLGSRLALGGLAAFVFAVPFLLLLLLVESQWQPLEELDEDVARELNEVARPRDGLVSALDFGAVALDPWVFRLAVLGTAFWFWTRGRRRLAVWAVVTAAIGGILGVVLKLLVERARPIFDEPVAHAGGYSFPSGHALNSMLCVVILLLLLRPLLGPASRVAAYAVGAALVLLTGFDRVALGVHYVSDVLAGWVVALACVAATTVAFEVWRREEVREHPATAEPSPTDADGSVRP
jgi:membrane-associated phospholipid phosphatase